ncbi:MAG: transcription termination factor NusA [Acutalibacteraceae bacterium]
MDNKEFFIALDILEKEKGIPADYMIMQIKKAIVIACKNTYNGNEDVNIIIDKEKQLFDVYLQKTVVEQVEDFDREISLDKAREITPGAGYGDKVGIKLDPEKFGRIAVQTSRSIIRQGIKDGEKDRMLLEFQSRMHEIVTAVVERVDPKTGNITLKVNEKAEAVLPKSEQVGDETFSEGDRIKVYIAEVRESEKGPRAVISRTHPDFVKRLFETEVPEIFDGTVEIKSVSREAGSRTKLAVYSKDPNVDALGACIGARRSRVGTIVNELGGEKIDLVQYHEEPEKYIAAALSPATVLKVDVAADGSKSCRVTVPDNQLSLAIGNKGQNARLAARLTGWKIDIRPESGFFGDDEEDEESDVLINNADTDEAAEQTEVVTE